jgi:DNA mismatch repair protein MutS
VEFRSVLYESEAGEPSDTDSQEPNYFHDLNLDQVVEAVTTDYREYNLEPFFYTRLKTVEAINYRHEVMRDLEDPSVLGCVRTFATQMRLMREQLDQSKKLRYVLQNRRLFLQAAQTYCVTIQQLSETLTQLSLTSRALTAFRDHVASYARSDKFYQLVNASRQVSDDLSRLRYTILISGAAVTVKRHAEERDYRADVVRTFEKFQQKAAKEYQFKFHCLVEMDHVEAKILEFVAALYPETFSKLNKFFQLNQDFAASELLRFDREIQFYIAWCDLVDKLKQVGLRFSLPRVAATDKAIYNKSGFDLALALKLTKLGREVVCNDFYLKGEERILIVSGPNQGGKTTFARTFGQLHHLASVGCPVPGDETQVFLPDVLLTHFEKGENLDDQRGKLQDELIRIYDALEKATARSIIIINEIFNATALADASFLARKVIGKIDQLDLLCVWVTFLDELASFNSKTVSMVSTVSPDNPNLRTYKVLRRPADGRSYAVSLAERHGLTYERLKARIPQ